MITEEILSETFALHADDRPEAQDVLAAVHQRVKRQRSIAITRAAAVLGAAATVTAVAVGVTVAAERPSGPGGVSGGGRPVTSPASMTASRPAAVTKASPKATRTHLSGAPSKVHTISPSGSRNYITIAAGWLPGNVTQETAQNSPGFEEHDYTVSVDGTEMDVIIWVLNGNSLPTRTEAGGNYRELTINGHHAREFIADVATIVAVDIGHGKIAFAGPSVVATNSTVTTARISAIARHVVRSIEYGRHDPLPKN
jgi:hypothetical protein